MLLCHLKGACLSVFCLFTLKLPLHVLGLSANAEAKLETQRNRGNQPYVLRRLTGCSPLISNVCGLLSVYFEESIAANV